MSRHPAAPALEEWISTKASSKDEQVAHSSWHVPTKEETQFANELLDLHLQSALDDLLSICQSNIHSDAGNFNYCFVCFSLTLRIYAYLYIIDSLVYMFNVRAKG